MTSEDEIWISNRKRVFCMLMKFLRELLFNVAPSSTLEARD